MIRTTNLTHSISRNAGGLYESVRRLVQSLADTGMEVQVLGTADEHTAADIGAWAPVAAKAFRPVGPHQFGYSPQFRQALEEFSPDLVHTHGLWLYPSVATNQYRRRRGIPYVISAHGMLDPWAVRNSRWRKVLAHFFYEGAHLREASCLRALCEPEARAIRQLGLKNPIAIIPNGIDLPPQAASVERGAQSAEEMSEIRNHRSEVSAPISDLWPRTSGQKVLLYLGRIHPKKGLVNLLKAWAQVNQKSEIRNQKSREWVLAIAGWDQGGHEAELKALARELGLTFADVREQMSGDGGQISEVGSQNSKIQGQKTENGNQKPELISAFRFQNFSVLFLGPQFNAGKVACYQNCDAFILPSLSEGVPMVVLEAWAYGKPVLMTPECNLPEGFAADAAIRIEPSVESIAAGLNQLFRSLSSDLQSLGTNGQTLVAARFTWPVLGKEMAGLYEWLIGGGTKPDCVVCGKS